jgi:hypothetical protein
VDFSSQLPRKAPLPRTVVPLVIMPPAMLADDYEAHVDDNGDGTGFIVDLTDLAHADAREPLAGVYMSPAADVRLPSGEWFVDFLRRTTRAAALPGLAAEQLPGLADVAAAWEPF